MVKFHGKKHRHYFKIIDIVEKSGETFMQTEIYCVTNARAFFNEDWVFGIYPRGYCPFCKEENIEETE